MLKFSSQISLRHFLLLVLLVGAAVGIAGSYWRVNVYQPLRITGTWHGKVPSQAARQALFAQAGSKDWLEGLADGFPQFADPLAAPDIGLVCDAETWNTIWQAWHGGKAPPIDFRREYVIAVKGEGPNTLNLETLTRNGAGDAKLVCWVTQVYGPGFCYLLVKSPRPAILSIDGKPVPTIDYRATKK